tara:strand:- start:1086 stop:1265 length:180 start_codon:yes stop_codon:yes gene_type:complete
MVKKPPLELLPKNLYQEERLNDINDAITRHLDMDFTFPTEWIEERNELIKQLKYGDFKQ